MAFEVVTTSFRQKERAHGPLRLALIAGVVTAAMACYASLMGLVLMFDGRPIVSGVLTLGQALLAGLPIACGYYIAAGTARQPLTLQVLAAGLGGLIAGSGLALLLAAGEVVNVRAVFLNASPQLMRFLAMGLPVAKAGAVLAIAGVALALAGAWLWRMPDRWRAPILAGIAACLLAALLRDLAQTLLEGAGPAGALHGYLYDWRGLTPHGAVALFAVAALCRGLAPRLRQRAQSTAAPMRAAINGKMRAVAIALGAVVVLALPVIAGPFVGQVMMLVVLFILMGLGLNIELGLAGLLDLGFVAFFAIGAYTMALLTSGSDFAIVHLSFWQALPVAALAAAVAGVIFGLPVLRVRGDYLAVATLGLGEIVRLLVVSELLKPSIGGSQGILGVPKPFVAGFELADPSHLVYVPVAACVLVAYCAWRLENSNIGRAWMALREDEDVAQGLGLDLVAIKLLAYGLGAAFAGVAGGIFASMVGAVFPHSFQLIISINVLALIILGGMGSIPGVMVGALALVGIPELLREFGEFRFLFYGIVLVVMMRFRPEGLWPSRAGRRVRADLEKAP